MRIAASASAAPRLNSAASFSCKGKVIPNPPSAINRVQTFSPCERSHGDCSEATSSITFGLRERSTREKLAALNSGIPNAKNVAAVPKLAARAFAISANRETLSADRPTIATRNEPSETCERASTIPRANDPDPITTMSAVFIRDSFTLPQPLVLAYI